MKLNLESNTGSFTRKTIDSEIIVNGSMNVNYVREMSGNWFIYL